MKSTENTPSSNTDQLTLFAVPENYTLFDTALETVVKERDKIAGNN